MAGRTTKRAEAAAQTYGISKEHWSAAKTQEHHARIRGRRTQVENKLATWGDVHGQEALFDTDTTD